MESKIINLAKLLCESFELELKATFRFCEGLKMPKVEYEGKIVYPETTQSVNFMLDRMGHFLDKTAFMIKGENLEYLNAILTSKMSFWYLKQICSTLGANGFSMSKIFVERLPIIDTTRLDSKILKDIESLACEILDSKQLDKEHSTLELESKLDCLIYQIYDLNEDEINIIESEFSKQERERERERIEIINNLYRLWESFMLDSTSQYQGKIMWNRISNELCFSYDEAGHYILDSMFMITSSNEFVIKYLLAVLNSSISKHWIKNNAATLGEGIYGAKIYIERLPVPKLDSTNQSIANEIISLINKILVIKQKDSTTSISELESKIDSLVYRLYNFTNKDISIIEI